MNSPKDDRSCVSSSRLEAEFESTVTQKKIVGKVVGITLQVVPGD